MAVIVWFRNDLRVNDHPALQAATKTGEVVIPLYVYDESCSRSLGEAAKWWLHHSLVDLQKSLKKRKADLILRQGNALSVLKDINKHIELSHIFWHDRYDKQGREQDLKIKEHFKHIICESYNGRLLFEPENHRNQEGNPFKVFSPFWKNCLKEGQVSEFISAPKNIDFDQKLAINSDDLDTWRLLPNKPDWAGGFRDTWQPGEEGAQKLFKEFLKDKLTRYKEKRNFPSALAISDLSPHICWGEISVRQLWHQVQEASTLKENLKSVECFLSELGWREFAYYTLLYNPQMVDEPLKKKFDLFPWKPNDSFFKAWSKGMTGYPLVDAGMRQLWQTGYMHNRVRLVVASFLIKDLLQPWQHGESWFWDTLVDADLANNTFNWQWVAGSGTDAAPYFRVFNPVLQSKKFDPEGEYIKTWVPELKNLDKYNIHEPWKMEKKVKNYPSPIVDHHECKKIALAAFEEIKQTE